MGVQALAFRSARRSPPVPPGERGGDFSPLMVRQDDRMRHAPVGMPAIVPAGDGKAMPG